MPADFRFGFDGADLCGGHAVFSEYLDLEHMPRVGELTIFCGSMVGSSLGFLWYNAYPAEIFMGDVGSLALGGALGTVAVLIKQELLLPFIGGIFVVEALSVILQVASFKSRGKRIFKMAIHHHKTDLIGCRILLVLHASLETFWFCRSSAVVPAYAACSPLSVIPSCCDKAWLDSGRLLSQLGVAAVFQLPHPGQLWLRSNDSVPRR